MISNCLRVYEKDDIVQYIANGLPIYSHGLENLQSFRFITSNFINQGLRKSTQVARCSGISINTVTRYLGKLSTQGEAAFFAEEKPKGYCHKIREKVLINIQKRY